MERYTLQDEVQRCVFVAYIGNSGSDHVAAKVIMGSRLFGRVVIDIVWNLVSSLL